MNFNQYIIEAKLQFNDLEKNVTRYNSFDRFEAFVNKLESGIPFEFVDKSIGSAVIEADPEWVATLRKQINARITPKNFRHIPLQNGKLLPLSELIKTNDLGGKPGHQAGSKFEELFYNQILAILQQSGPFKLLIDNDMFFVTDVSEPSRGLNTKSDLRLTLNDGTFINLSLKQFPFPTYAGIGQRGRLYQQALSSHRVVKNFIIKFKKYLMDHDLCANKHTNDILNVKCNRKHTAYFYTPEEDEEFTNLALFGDKQFVDEFDYVDYIIKGNSIVSEPLIYNEQEDYYEINPQLEIYNYGDPIPPNMKPGFLARTANGRNDYNIKDTRIAIVPVQQIEFRSGVDVETGKIRVKKPIKKQKTPDEFVKPSDPAFMPSL